MQCSPMQVRNLVMAKDFFFANVQVKVRSVMLWPASPLCRYTPPVIVYARPDML